MGGRQVAGAGLGGGPLAALTGAALLARRRDFRAMALVGAALVAVGILWSNALAYREVNLALRGQLTDLEHVARLAAGRGPTLMTEFSSIGARHILRGVDAESASELRRRPIPLRDGSLLPRGAHADVDAFDPSALHEYRSLVVRRGPTSSRPPSAYRLRWAGSSYELWQRPVGARSAIEHLPLGNGDDPGGTPRCADVRRLAREAGPSGRLATVPRERPAVVNLGSAGAPAEWTRGSDGREIFAAGPGTVERMVLVRADGPVKLWLEGSARGRVTVAVDGHAVGSARHQLTWAGGFIPLGSMSLTSGTHRVTLRYADRGLQPGNLGQELNPFAFGPLVLARESADVPVATLTSAHWHCLCGRHLDWIEALPST